MTDDELELNDPTRSDSAPGPADHSGAAPVPGDPSDGTPPPAPGRDLPAPPGATAVDRLRAFGRWLTLRESMQAAQAALQALTPEQRQHIRRARHALELADRLLEPVEPLRTGPADDLAIDLYRQAALWALAAHGAPATSPAEAFANADPPLLAFAAGSEGGVDEMRMLLVEQTFVQTAALALQARAADAKAARAFVHALLSRLDEPQRRLVRLRCWLGVGLALVVALGVAASIGVVTGIQSLSVGPDLAAGAPWRASSAYGGFDPATGICDGQVTAIFFHTDRQPRPWVEIDLGSVQPIENVELHNRTDCCSERAVPLVVEVSSDRRSWRTLAHRDEDFRTWTAQFGTTRARYVRIRATRATWLHLEKVIVH